MGGQLAFNAYQRKITMVKKSSNLCMVAEAAGINWVMGGPGYTSNKNTVDGEDNWMSGLAARHGRGSNPRHAYTNIAFFDGHVAAFDTKPLSTYVNSVNQALYGVNTTTNVLTPGTSFGQPLTTAGQRIMQVAIKVMF